MKVKAKVDGDTSVYEHDFHEKEEPGRINLNDLLKRSKDEKAKIRKTNIIVLSAVFCSAALVVVIITYL